MVTRILGIDPGLETTGYGLIVVEGQRPVADVGGTITTTPRHAVEARVATLYDQMRRLLDTRRPDAVVLEELFAHYAHPTTAILMGHARGVIALAVAQCRVPLYCYLPTRVKKAVTGNGHATKRQVQGMVTALLQLPAPPEPHDISDAFALALAHAHARHQPVQLLGASPRRRRLPKALQVALAGTAS
jgi:crossover junction endodeoxyribonuclease RuvC